MLYADSDILRISGRINTEIAVLVIKMHKDILCFLAVSYFRMITLEIFA